MSRPPQARQLHVLACHACGMVLEDALDRPGHGRCPQLRCHLAPAPSEQYCPYLGLVDRQHALLHPGQHIAGDVYEHVGQRQRQRQHHPAGRRRILAYDPVTQRFPSVVGIEVYPQRLGRALDKLPKTRAGTAPALFLQRMVEHGLRAQARSGNLLTGQLYIAVDFVANAPKVNFDVTAHPLTLPTINGDFDHIQEQVANIVAKVDKIPLDSIGRHLDASLASLDLTLKQVNSQVLPEATRTLQQAQQTFGSAQGMLADDAPLQQSLNQSLLEVRRAAQSMRELTDLLGRHPESLLRGRPDDPKPAKAHVPLHTQESAP